MLYARSRQGPDVRRLSSERPGNVAGKRLRLDLSQGITNDPLARDPSLAKVEAVLLMADEPLTAKRLSEVVGLSDAAEARRQIAALQNLYDSDGSSFQVELIAGGYQLLTRPAYQPWLTRWRRMGGDLRLSATAMETLAVIAYRQPVMRAELEKIRGVACGEIVRQLMEKGLVKIVGRDSSLGRPQLYGTTKRFLQAFGLNTLKDLPTVEVMRPPASA